MMRESNYDSGPKHNGPIQFAFPKQPPESGTTTLNKLKPKIQPIYI
jgi:hypothetical protein